jgi:hypothetical protein
MSEGWDALNEAVAEARALIAAEAPGADIAAEGEAYVARVAAAALSGAVLGHLFQEGGLSRALPVQGGPNPDYIMRHAGIDPTRHYRLTGQLNGSERVGVGLYTLGRNGAPLLAVYTAFGPTKCDEQGAFALDIAADASGPGTLAIPSGARILLIRVLHRDASIPARLNLAGGSPARGLALMTGSPDGALRFVVNTLRNNVREYLKWMVAARDLPNRFDTAPPELAETVQGDADTRYFLGGFDLAEDEWLEVTMPEGLSGYWSLHAYNFWYEHLQTPGVHDRNAVPDPDGRIRIAVAPHPVEGRNHIDTIGRRKGAFICRIIGTGGCPQALLRRMAV